MVSYIDGGILQKHLSRLAIFEFGSVSFQVKGLKVKTETRQYNNKSNQDGYLKKECLVFGSRLYHLNTGPVFRMFQTQSYPKRQISDFLLQGYARLIAA